MNSNIPSPRIIDLPAPLYALRWKWYLVMLCKYFRIQVREKDNENNSKDMINDV